MRYLLFLFSVFSFISFSQQKERWLLYPDSEANSVLYAKNSTLSTKKVLTGFMDYRYRNNRLKNGGISKADQKLIEQGSKMRNKENPRMKFTLGEQATKPLANYFSSDDSVVVLADGTTEYVYPARDSLYFVFDYDELLVKEIQQINPQTGKAEFVPDQFIFRCRFPGVKELITTAVIEMRDLENDGYYFTERLSDQVSKDLLKKMALYFSQAKNRFGEQGAFQPVEFRHLVSRSLPGYFNVYQSFPEGFNNSLLRNLPELFLTTRCQNTVLTNRYGEDSIYIDLSTKEVLWAFERKCDTSFYVTDGFEKVVKHQRLFFNSAASKWHIRTIDYFLEKKLILSDLPFLVYAADGGRSLVFDSCSDDTRLLINSYAELNDPLYQLLRNSKNEPVLLEWYEKLLQHSLSYKIVDYR